MGLTPPLGELCESISLGVHSLGCCCRLVPDGSGRIGPAAEHRADHLRRSELARFFLHGHEFDPGQLRQSGGREYQFELNTDGENILDAGLRNGVDLPFSCKGGVCATCKARLIKGDVEMDLNQALRPEEIAAGFILTCQSHPTSAEVVVDYDQT